MSESGAGVHTRGSGAPVLVCLHPMGLSAEMFEALQGLEGTVIALDLPGHGSAAWSARDYVDMSALTESVTERILALGLDEFELFGASLGGMVAQRIAAAHPELVAALYLVNTAALLPEPQRDNLRSRIALLGESGVDDLGRHTVDRWFPSLESSAARKTLSWFNATDAHVHRGALECALTLDNSDVLADIECDTWILTGDHDLNTTARESHALGTAIARSHTDVAVGCGHMVTIEEPDIVVAWIRSARERSACPATGDNRMRHIA